MANPFIRRCIMLGLAAVTIAAGAFAQVPPCPEGKVALSDELDRLEAELDRLEAEAKAAVAESREEAVDAPSELTEETQVAAPSSSGASTSLVDEAGFPSLFGLALESGLVESDEGAITIDLNPFAAVALARPKARTSQTEYQKYEDLRRFGGSLTLGGKGETFDRDGDGEDDEALEAKDLRDIVNWELRVRLTRSRDPRDRTNYVPMLEATEATDLALSKARRDLRLAALQQRQRLDLDNEGCVDRDAFEAFAQEMGPESFLAEVRKAKAAAEAAFADAKKIVDNRPLWTLVFGGVERDDEFGPDSMKAALRGAFGDHSVNFEWMETEGLNGADDPETLKFGYEYSTKWFKGEVFPDGIEASASASWEWFDNVPEAMHEDNAKASLKLEFPFGDGGISVPLSITWANHADLLQDEDEVRGHIGISYDLSKLLKPKAVP